MSWWCGWHGLNGVVEQIAGCASAADLGGWCGWFAARPTGARAEFSCEVDWGCASAPDLGATLLKGPHLVPRERVQNRTPEQVMDSPVPQIMEADLHIPQERGLPVVPQERLQNRVPEQFVGFLVPQIVEERVQNRTQVNVADSPVPQFMEAAVENRVGEQFADSPTPRERGGSRGSWACYTTGARAESSSEALRGIYQCP